MRATPIGYGVERQGDVAAYERNPDDPCGIIVQEGGGGTRWKLTAYAGGYASEWGLEIERYDAREDMWILVYRNPNALSADSYGHDWPEDPRKPGKRWTGAQWRERLGAEAWDLIECFVSEDLTVLDHPDHRLDGRTDGEG